MEITIEAQRAELITNGTQHKSREQFEKEFAASVASISRALKPDRWFTLVYKHKDLSLWQSIVAACEDSGLHYVNAIWQDVNIHSTGQIENPNINPPGDMYLNFRKMPSRKFELIYGQTRILDLPTRANYVEHEIERLIVAYLGASIELITSGVIQQVLDSRAFYNYRENPTGVTEDIREILKSPRFATWQPDGETVFWIMAPDVQLDVSVEATDRIRYLIFDLLRKENEVSEAIVRQYILTHLSKEHDLEPFAPDIIALLRIKLYQQIAQQVFNDLGDDDVFVQFRLITLQEWQHAESLARKEDREEALGITLLGRA